MTDNKIIEQEETLLLRRKLDLLLRTGKLLVESAADTNRVVRNMKRVAAYWGYRKKSFILMSAIRC